MIYSGLSRSSLEADNLESVNFIPSKEDPVAPVTAKQSLRIYASSVERVFIFIALLLPSFLLLSRSPSARCSISLPESLKSRTVEREFGFSFDYMSIDASYDHLWDDLSLHGRGGGMIQDENGDLASITMFHQIHCLQVVRTALQKARAGHDIGVNQHDDGHWPHCLDYLRQVRQTWCAINQ
jgi:hypothetical protein